MPSLLRVLPQGHPAAGGSGSWTGSAGTQAHWVAQQASNQGCPAMHVAAGMPTCSEPKVTCRRGTGEAGGSRLVSGGSGGARAGTAANTTTAHSCAAAPHHSLQASPQGCFRAECACSVSIFTPGAHYGRSAARSSFPPTRALTSKSILSLMFAMARLEDLSQDGAVPALVAREVRLGSFARSRLRAPADAVRARSEPRLACRMSNEKRGPGGREPGYRPAMHECQRRGGAASNAFCRHNSGIRNLDPLAACPLA